MPPAACRPALTSDEIRLFEALAQFGLAVLEPGRENQGLADLARRLIRGPALRRGPGQFEQGAAGRPHIAGFEVIAVLLLRNVGKTESLDMSTQLELGFLVAHIEREMVDGAARQGPGALAALAVGDHLDTLDD